MIELQYLNKILSDKDYQLIAGSWLTEDFFPSYTAEFRFIKNHYDKYNKIPDLETFLNEFPKFNFLHVGESDDYLISKLKESRLYNMVVPILQEGSKKVQEDSNLGVSYFLKQLETLPITYGVTGEDIIQSGEKRYETLIDKAKNRDKYFFKSGLEELDMITGGIQRKEEFIVLFARTNQGKSWISQKMAISVWEQGYNVGYFSPEMSAESIGYRFDTMYMNFSNSMLVNAVQVDDELERYKIYLEKLREHKNKFLVATPKNFGKNTTASAVKSWIIENKLDFVVIDGLTYMKNERGKRNEKTTEALKEICEDLMEITVDLPVPIIGVVQANREAINKDADVITAPTLETIRDSDGIAHNATKVFSMIKIGNSLELDILKQRNGRVGSKLLWDWDVDRGFFQYKPNKHSGLDEYDAKISGELTGQFNDSQDFTEVF